jgi:crossover junction endodeoxyribonuclease RusA
VIRFDLPFPPRELSPNARVHWGIKAREARKARQWAAFGAIAAGARGLGVRPVRVLLSKPRASMDDDNARAMLKAYQDGISDALGCNDNRLPVTVEIGPCVRGGRVTVEIG